MAGRFPGAKNIHEFWNNLKNGLESIVFFSDRELEEAGADPGVLKNPRYVKASGILEDIEYFDASFFDYTPKEAEIMYPQMRLFHECVWTALEDAGYDPGSYHGLIGLYAGAASSFYWEALAHLSGKSAEFGRFAADCLTFKDFLCTQISFKLNLKGPAVLVQTACSTSLVAIHQACRALLTGECKIALAGGGTIVIPQLRGYLYQEGMIPSADGHCRTFDAKSAGTVMGSGMGVAVLKVLKDAASDRDHIYALIKGTAINNDGNRKLGYTAPSVEGQAETIRKAQRMAQVNPESISYIEAHGTGTELGDPVEIEALKVAFNTGKKNFCPIGSVKTNVGHLDNAAGAAGFIKTVLALKHKLIPPSLHYKTPNPKIDFENTPFFVNTVLREWKNDQYPLRAGVSSFGIGGTNAHVILEEAPIAQSAERKAHGAFGQGRGGVSPPRQSREYQLILLSAKTQSALDKMTANLAEYFKTNPDINLADSAYTLQVGRRAFSHRRMCVCSTINRAIAALTSPDAGKLHTFCSKVEDRPVIFMFSGQGSQYVNMGLNLYQKESIFREEMDRCFEILKPLMGCDVKEILYPHSDCRGGSPCRPQDYSGSPGQGGSARSPDIEDSPLERGTPDPRKGGGVSLINQTEITQPVLFAFEYALAKLVMKWGIKPYAMIGHSIGEYAAAHLTGVFSLEDALKLVVLRGHLMQKMPSGSMLSVPLPQYALNPLLNEELSMAAVNTPSLCVVSGSYQAIKNLAEQLKEKGYDTRFLHTSHAFHSKMMEPILGEFEKKVKEIQLNKPAIPYISNLTGNWTAVSGVTDPGYWAAHLRQTVRFADGINELLKREDAIFVEIGPGKTLSTFVRQHPNKTSEQSVINLIRHSKESVVYDDDYYLLSKIGQLWLYGKAIDWTAFHSQKKTSRLSLPGYPFEGQRYWIDGDPFKIYKEMFFETSGIKKKKDIANWFYIPSWKRTGAVVHGTGENWNFSNVLVFSDGCDIGTLLAKQLEQKGKRVCIVKAGKRFAKNSDSVYIINPKESQNYDALFEDLKLLNKVPQAIVHLWSLTNNEPGKTDGQRFEKAQELGFYSQIYMLQAIKKQHLSNDFKITVVSNHIQDVTGEEIVRPEKTTVLGSAKVIPQEFPNLIYRCVDVALPEPGSSQKDQLIEHLLAEISAESPDTVIAYRNNRRWVQTFEPVSLDEKRIQRGSRLREKGVYLITGGLGGIGLILAKHLAAAVRAKLILTRRSDFPARTEWEKWLSTHKEHDSTSVKIKRLLEIEAMGSEVIVFKADTANQEQMQEVFLKSEKKFGPINGVFHAAGITNEKSNQCPVERISGMDCEQQFKPKVYGLVVLEKLLREKELDFCLLMSSLSTVLGGLGFAAYAAANHYMDAFVQKQCQAGSLHWITVNWDGWKIREMVNPDTGDEPKPHESFILPGEGEIAFQHILSCHRENQVVVSISDLQHRLEQWIDLKSLREEGNPSKPETSSKKTRPNLSNPFVAPRNQTEQALAGIWENLFGYEKLGIHDDFFELGGDSLKMMTVVSKIHKELDAEVPLMEFFNQSTIKGLAEYIKSSEKGEKFISLELIEEKEFYALSSAQQRLYVLQELDKNSTGYNLAHAVLLEGNLNRGKLEEAFKKLIKRHETLRTSIQLVDGEPVQVIHDEAEFGVEYCETRENEAKGILKNSIRPFDLSKAPFFRVGLIKVGEEKHILVIDMHHLITDAVSFNIFVDDFQSLYQGNELSPLKFRYKDYSEWGNRIEIQKGLKSQEAYWLKQFKGVIPVLDMPADFPRPGERKYKGGMISFDLGVELSKKLRELAKKTGTTMYMILLSAYNILLSKYTKQEDIVVGSPIPGRRCSDLQNIMGIFVNMLAMRNHPCGCKTYSEFISEVKENALNAYENQDYPFDKLVMKLGLQGSLNRNPLFDTVLQMEFDAIEMDKDDSQDNHLKITPYSLENKQSVFDLVLFVLDSDERVKLVLRYSTALFEKSRSENMTKHYIEILEQITADINIKLQDISISHELLRVKSKHLQDVQGDFGF